MRRITKAGIQRRLSRGRSVVVSQVRAAHKKWERRGPRLPVDFENWLERRSGRKTAEFPDTWRARDDLYVEDPSTVGVLLHVFYPELLPELLMQLDTIPVRFDLIVTDATGEHVRLDRADVPRARHIVVLEVDNHGRDIWPMVQVVNAGLLDPYEIVLKLHTKRSEWRAEHADLPGTGEAWRANLMSDLLGTRDNVTEILGAFADNPDLGIVTARGNVLGPEFWGGDLAITRELLRRLELQVHTEQLRFPAGSFYWARGFVLQGLRALALTSEDFDREAGQVDATTAHGIERSMGLLADEAGLLLRERPELSRPSEEAWQRYEYGSYRLHRTRVIPFYLPQFHPIPENDRWWGTGFTEWTNVSAARPVYQGHNQPNLPADLGFYDLRLDTVRQAQMDLAAAHGIEGFMYYYYWFAGRRVLSEPIEALLASDVNKPFCLMWANENWTRRWDGRTSDVLMGQDYDRIPATQFIDDVLPFLQDSRYLRVDGRPVVAVYRVGQIPDLESVLDHWRERARGAGLGELLLLNVDVAREFDGLDGAAKATGLDGTLGFPPHNLKWQWVPHAGLRVDSRFTGNILDYGAMIRDAERRMSDLDDGAFPGVMVTFDNTARRQWNSDIWFGSNPYSFRRWLAAACSAVAHREHDQRIVFVNAWNEWAESAVLEPSHRYGRTFLLAVRDVVHG
ncbi:MAG: glycoside hydrolase family 99-like domain-containing protein [Nocardioidaceae bacterium]